MNILVLNYEFPPLGGGASPVSRDISRELYRSGHCVTVVTMGFEGLPEYEEQDGVKIYRLKCWRSKKSSCMPWEQYTYIIAAEIFLRKHFKRHKYDVCHVHFVIPTGVAALWVKKHYGIPYVITAHGSDVEGYNQKKYMKVMHKLLRPFWRKIVSDSVGVIAPSEFLLSLMKKEKANGNYPLIPNGLDLRKYSCENEAKEKRILLMGRMQKSKNIQTVLRAIALTNLKDWKVDVLGDGPYRSELEMLTKNLGLAQKVTFHGWIDNSSPEQLRFLKEASIYITASHFENCPMAVLETIAAGCYPLLSDIPAHRQFLQEDKYFFPMNDEKALSVKIQFLINNTAEIYSNEIDIEKYDWSRIIKQYEAVLECKLLGQI